MTQKNPDFLDQIPDALLNSTLKVKVDQARGRILERSMSDARAVRAQRDDDRQEARRSAFQEINTLVSTGQPMNPMNYLHLDPDVYTYAMAARDRPTLSGGQSATNVSLITQEILTTSSLGTSKSLSQYRDQINGNPNLNPTDQVALIEKLPMLMEGRNVLSDPRLIRLISTNIAPALADMQQHIEVKMGRFDGISLRADVMRRINERVRSSFVSDQISTGVWPTGNAADVLINKAIAEGEAMITNRLNAASVSQAAVAAPATNRGTPAATPRAAMQTPSARPRAAPTPAPAANSIDDAVAAELARRQ
jgi:hypothetical protein